MMKTLTPKGIVRVICRGLDSCFTEEKAKKKKDELSELFMDLTMSRGMEGEGCITGHLVGSAERRALEDSEWLDHLASLFDEEANKKRETTR